MKKIYYIANIRLPTEKAHGIQIMEMCQAFADKGFVVELWVTNRSTPIHQDPFEYYGVKKNFKIRRVWCLDWVRFGKFGFLIETSTFVHTALFMSLFKKGIFYTRDEVMALHLRVMGRKEVIWEAHRGEENIIVKTIIALGVPIVAISTRLKSLYIKLGAKESQILVAPDGISLEKFSVNQTKEEARNILGLPIHERIVLYTGHLYSWKGASVLAEASTNLPQTQIYLIGGTDSDILQFKVKYGKESNIHILGKKPHQEIPLYLKSADILVIPNSANENISRLYTSPMKLFEYMSSGVPIVASDLPSIREILDEQSASFFKADDSENLAKTIKMTFEDYPAAQKRANLAKSLSEKYTWQRRIQEIVSFTHA